MRPDLPVDHVAPVTGKEAVAGGGTALHCRPIGPTAPHLPIKIRGWAYSRSGIERVEVFVDGRSRHEAIHGLTRPHLKEALGTPDAVESGYYLLLDPYVFEPGEHVLTVVATPTEGPPVAVSRSFLCTDDARAARGEGEPSVPAERAPRPRSADARHPWVGRLAAGRAVLDADREAGDLSGPLPFESDSFDLVTCFDALGRAEEPDAALAELCRVLRPAGLLVASWRGSAGLEPSVRRRFENVRAYRQEDHAASVLVDAVTIAVASDGPLPELPGLAIVGPDAGWRERAFLAEAEAAANLTERAQAQRGEERAFMFLRAAEERLREAERALERRPLRRLRRRLSRLRGGS